VLIRAVHDLDGTEDARYRFGGRDPGGIQSKLHVAIRSCSEPQAVSSLYELKSLTQVFDKNNDGHISAAELKHVMSEWSRWEEG